MGDMPLTLTDRHFQSPRWTKYIFPCRGIARDVPIIIDKIEVHLDFHIYDIMDFDLLLGFPLDELLDKSQGSLDVKLREAASTTSISCHEHSMVEPLPEQNPLETIMHVSPFASSEPVPIEVVDFSTPQGNDSGDSLHLCGGERSSSISTEFQPLPAGPYYVAFDYDRESTSCLHDASLERR